MEILILILLVIGIVALIGYFVYKIVKDNRHQEKLQKENHRAILKSIDNENRFIRGN